MIRRGIPILLGLLCAGVCAAQAPLTLTLPEAVSIALSENPTVRIADMEVERYDYVKRATWGNLLPQLSVDGQYAHTFIKQNMSKGFEMGAKQYDNLSAELTLALPLFAPQVYRTLQLNKTQMATAVEQARATRIDLVAEVKKSFYNLLLAEQSLEVLRRSEANIRQTVDDTELRYRNGLASEYDLLTAQVQLSNLKPTILQTENSIRVAKLLLKMYLSIPEEVEIEAAGTLDGLRDEVFAGADRLTTDLSDNSTLRQLELQREQLAGQLRLQNATRWPTLSLFGNFTLTGTNMGSIDWSSVVGGGNASDARIDRSWYWQNPLIGGLQLSVPIFAGLTKANQSRSIRNQIAQIELQRQYTQQSLDVEVRSSINDLLTAREQMFAQEETVRQAEKAYSISDTRYGAGAGTILELNTSELSLTQARLNFSQAIYDYLSAKAEYDRVIGRTE